VRRLILNNRFADNANTLRKIVMDIITSDLATATEHQQDTGSHMNVHVGLSACLAGHEVRYNGGHSQSRFCLNTLSKYFVFKTFCPEVAAGFPVPRPTMRLIGDVNNPTLTYSDNNEHDLTEQLQKASLSELEKIAHLDGYVLMKNSPSCGFQRVKVYQPSGYPHDTRRQGLFTEQLQKKYPLLPIEEDGRLNDPKLRENFILRVYAHHYFRHEVLAQPSLHNLIKFHSRYKYTLMAHHQGLYKKLGKMLAGQDKQPINTLCEQYFLLFMQALAKPASTKNQANALLHMLGYLKKSVPSQARQHLADIIDKYRENKLPLITPVTLLSHYVLQYGSTYIREQRYFQPYPEALGLRNRV